MYEIENIPIVIKPVSFEDFYSSMENQKYRKHYERLIDRAQNRTLDEYSERHHIIPKCLGGVNDNSNYARLTAPEHYVAHQLLCKTFPKNKSLIFAAVYMSASGRGNGRSSNKVYGWLRTQLSESLKNREFTEETRGKMSKAWETRIVSDETKAKMSLIMTGRDLGKVYPEHQRVKMRHAKSEQGRENIRKAAKTRKPATEEAKENMRLGHTGKIATAEQRLNMSIAQTGHETSEETRRKIGEGNKGKEVTAETREKHRINGTGRWHTEESKALMSIVQTGHNCTEETKAKISASKIGKKLGPWSDEHRANMKITQNRNKIVKEILAVWSCAL